MINLIPQKNALMIRSDENDSVVIHSEYDRLRYENVTSVRPGEDLIELFEIENLLDAWLDAPIA